MAFIDTVDEQAATGELKEVYDKLLRSRGKVANIMKVHSLNLSAMQAHMDLYLAVMFGRSGLKRAERELIAVVVSATNGCAYCVQHHAEALNNYWKDSERVRHLTRDFRHAGLSGRETAMLEYAVKLTNAPETMAEADVAALRAQGLEDGDVLDLNLITSYFNFVNRIALGLGVDVSPEEVSGYRY